jgi:hypothetical protein
MYTTEVEGWRTALIGVLISLTGEEGQAAMIFFVIEAW